MGCITSKTVITENPNRFDVIFADTEQTIYYSAQLEINGNHSNDFQVRLQFIALYFQEATLSCIVKIRLHSRGHYDH